MSSRVTNSIGTYNRNLRATNTVEIGLALAAVQAGFSEHLISAEDIVEAVTKADAKLVELEIAEFLDTGTFLMVSEKFGHPCNTDSPEAFTRVVLEKRDGWSVLGILRAEGTYAEGTMLFLANGMRSNNERIVYL